MGQKIFKPKGRVVVQKDTKKLISSTFVELLSSKPFDRITIKDIVDACGINRNTFYYYYSDIYDLLEEIFMKELNELVDAHKEGESWAASFIKVAYVAYNHKKLINNICISRSYDYFENYMDDLFIAFNGKTVNREQFKKESIDGKEFYVIGIAGVYDVTAYLPGKSGNISFASYVKANICDYLTNLLSSNFLFQPTSQRQCLLRI